ncbi:MAG TPA: glycosyltransferase [Methanomicrobiales archaeon]|nr:glycosyltransferase [Methanomicrobiales archaeon]
MTGGIGEEKGDGRGRGLVSIILPSYNERESILALIDDILRYVPAPVEIIVVDDDSPDLTWRLVIERADPRVRLVRRVGARGLASAVVRGIIEAEGDVIGWMDVDMAMIPPLLPAMLAGLRDHDMVLASRYVAGGGDRRDRLRVATSRVLNRLANLVLSGEVKDFANGVVVMRRSVLDTAIPVPVGYGEYFIRFLYVCLAKGVRVHEHPYVLEDREKGVSKSSGSLNSFLALGFHYCMAIFRARLQRID